MHKHENYGSPRVNLQQTKGNSIIFLCQYFGDYWQYPATVPPKHPWASVVLDLLFPDVALGMWLMPFPAPRVFGLWGTPVCLPSSGFSRGQWSCMLLPSPKLVCLLPALQISWWSQNSWREDQSLVQQWQVGFTRLFLPLEDAYFHKCWAVVLWNR